MKKQFFVLALMILSGVLITSRTEHGLKACGTGTAAGSTVNKCSVLKGQQGYVEDADVAMDLLMNPFIQL